MKKLAAFASALALVFLMSTSTFAQASTPVKKVDAKEVKKEDGKKDGKTTNYTLSSAKVASLLTAVYKLISA